MALPDAAGVPDWLHLLPAAGVVRTVDGRGPYRVGDVTSIIAASIAAGKLPIDENHATDLAAPKGGAAPARGWIVELQSRDDGIWGRVEWTGPGRRIMEDREYRGLSPAIVHDRAGNVHAIARASLTNTPNLTGLTALHQLETTMDLRLMLIEALGLDSEADDAAIIAAVKAKKGDASVVALQAALAPIVQVIGLPAGADADAIVAGVRRLKAAGSDSEALVALQSELADTATRLTALTDATTRKDAVAFVDGAIGAGRVGVKPMRDRYITMHMADPAGTAELINALPAIKGGATLGVDPPAGGDGLGAADLQVIALMGVDRAAYAASHAEYRQETL